MNSPPGTTDTPRTANRPYTSSKSTESQLCKIRLSMKEQSSCKVVEATDAEEAGATEAEGAINLLTKSTGKMRNVSIAIRKDIHPQVYQRQKRTPTTHLVHHIQSQQKV